MITGIDESETSTKHISWKLKCRFDGKNVIEINGGWWMPMWRWL